MSINDIRIEGPVVYEELYGGLSLVSKTSRWLRSPVVCIFRNLNCPRGERTKRFLKHPLSHIFFFGERASEGEGAPNSKYYTDRIPTRSFNWIYALLFCTN